MSNYSRLYKYRSFSAESLALLINRKLYFACPSQLNDPYDCQISIRDALRSAVESVEGSTDSSITDNLAKFGSLDHIYEKMETDVSSVGILSLSKQPNHALMWAHYADQHRGFCLGFELTERFTRHNEDHLIIGCSAVEYCETNPYYEYFVELAKAENVPTWNEFWVALLSIGMVAKATAWDYEKEVRVLRKFAGTVPFEPASLKEVVFGSRLEERNRETLRALLSGPDWNHVQFRESVKSPHDFVLEITDV